MPPCERTRWQRTGWPWPSRRRPARPGIRRAWVQSATGRTQHCRRVIPWAMKIDFDGVQAFVLVAELGGFNKAAEQLHITQTALTRRIQKLEAYLGLKLLDRTTRRVEMTAVGRDFLPQARAIVNEMTTAVGRLKDMSQHAKGN